MGYPHLDTTYIAYCICLFKFNQNFQGGVYVEIRGTWQQNLAQANKFQLRCPVLESFHIQQVSQKINSN